MSTCLPACGHLQKTEYRMLECMRNAAPEPQDEGNSQVDVAFIGREQNDMVEYKDEDARKLAVPTAYDPDKVVEQLEKEKNPLYREDGNLMGERTVIGIDKVIEIVKGGGVDVD